MRFRPSAQDDLPSVNELNIHRLSVAMGDVKLKAAILIISDTASKDPSTDKAGKVLTETFSTDGDGRWTSPVIEIVPDDVLDIQRTVKQWSDAEDYFNLVVTTGGTGFAVKDITPEVNPSAS